MKEKWKVFIRGNKDRGEEVIKALEDCGASNSCGYIGDYDAALYFINHNGIIDSTRDYNAEFTKIIMDNYTELHLPEKWKDGDVLVTGQGLLFVLKGDYQVGDKDATIGAYCCVSEHQVCLSGHFSQIGSPHLASPSEVEHFHELMHKYGKDWDAEKKEVVDWRWEPKEDDSYYYIDNDGEIVHDSWDECNLDTDRYNFGNCFRSYNQAEQARKKLRETLMSCHRNDDADE